MHGVSPPFGKPRPIDLAHQQDFQLGLLTVKPSTREIVRPDGSREVLEPRVMQVLAALRLASPNVLSRDDLIAQCWDGRIVGDDAINAAIGKLRRLSGTGEGGFFTVETIPRVGYRLVAGGEAQPALEKNRHQAEHSGNRRALLAGGVAAGAVALAGGGWWLTKLRSSPPPPAQASADVTSLIARANATMRRGRLENDAEAVALFQQAVDLAPGNADAWGGLAFAHQFLARNGAKERYQAERLRAEAALDKALALDPYNPFALQTKGSFYLSQGDFLECEQTFRQGLAHHPGSNELLLGLAEPMMAVGRMREAASLMDRAVAAASHKLDQAMAWISIASYTGARRWVDADRAAAEGLALFPRHPLTWLNHLYLLMFSGRAAEALVTLRDISSRPDEVPAEEVDGMIAVATALVSGARADIANAAAAELALADKNLSPLGKAMGIPAARTAANALMFLSSIGRVDDAFRVARSVYNAPEFGTVFTVFKLFEPGSRAMRKDSRFPALMDQMRLTEYWQKAGIKPDYQVYPDG